MSSDSTIYRVTARTTGSVQPGRGATFWQREVLYCGTDRSKARVAYHASSPKDYGGSYGNRARETVMEIIEDAETGDAADDTVTEESV